VLRLQLIFGVGLIHCGILMTSVAAQGRHSDLTDPGKPTAGTISVDLLRHRVSTKVMERLQDAQRAADAGDDAAAIERLETILAKYPESAAWAQPMLGVEYLKTYQLQKALPALEQAVVLLPRDAVSRSNLGLCLILTNQYDRAEKELRRAVQLDSRIAKTRELLQLLLSKRHQELAQNPN
jgi:Flp pilus assembly protein TadD